MADGSLKHMHLTLEDCKILPPPSFKGFEMLISMKLCCVEVSPELLGRLISGCPLLEQLALQMLDFSSGIIEINAPKLKSFDFTGNINAICLKNIPLLAKFSLAFRGWHGSDAQCHGIAKFFNSFSVLKHLHLDNHSVRVLAAAGELQTGLLFRFDSVKCLYLSGLYLSELYNVSCVFRFMRTFPYLQYLEIKVDNSAVLGALNFFL
uniref:F-box/LRR-repeat protein 15/At3g58940/PEG3-like LRR domain-containing protein n=1 Tax=Nicotiana tabacum TaxID=4097 RepID=A0A1S3Z2X3_TOBAC|nr:PREDICTED: uncharacterized protein LOC107782414 [Nicotiana tabacum]